MHCCYGVYNASLIVDSGINDECFRYPVGYPKYVLRQSVSVLIAIEYHFSENHGCNSSDCAIKNIVAVSYIITVIVIQKTCQAPFQRQAQGTTLFKSAVTN